MIAQDNAPPKISGVNTPIDKNVPSEKSPSGEIMTVKDLMEQPHPKSIFKFGQDVIKGSRANGNKPKKMAIVGYAPTRDEAPFTNPDYEVWGMNDLWAIMPNARFDRWFDLHDEKVMKNNPRTGPQHWEWLKQLPPDDGNGSGMPVYTLEDMTKDIPAAVTFPLQDLIDYYKEVTFSGDYFTSTPAYMMALGIKEGFEEIAIYGINLLGQDEYEYQRPCMEYWVGVAMGRGIEVFIPDGSTLCKSNFRYGYDTHHRNETFLKHVGDRITEYVKTHDELLGKLHQVKGGIETLNYIKAMIEHENRGGFIP